MQHGLCGARVSGAGGEISAHYCDMVGGHEGEHSNHVPHQVDSRVRDGATWNLQPAA